MTTLEVQTVGGSAPDMTRVVGVHEDNLKRDAGLRIRSAANGGYLWLGYGDLFQPPREWDSEVNLTSNDLFAYVEECRKVWWKEVVERVEPQPDPNGGLRNSLMFQEQWNLSQRPDILATIGPKLALAGSELFFHVFEDNADLNRLAIADQFRNQGRQRPLTITVTSADFFVPWGMLYVHPDPQTPLKGDGSNFSWDGFWGFRHIIEHNTQWVNLETELRPDPDGRLQMSVNIDETIDRTLNVPCIVPQLSFFNSQPKLNAVVRRQLADLQKALSATNFADQILYFCCHGQGGSQLGQPTLTTPAIALTDHTPMTAANLRFWLNGKPLASQPLVFINACQGGQAMTLFYKTLTVEFLNQKAVGCIGAQIDIPAVFAAEYGQRFFQRFLNGNNSNRKRVGPLMRELAQEFIIKHNNPLGLVYSLYRGADCFLGG